MSHNSLHTHTVGLTGIEHVVNIRSTLRMFVRMMWCLVLYVHRSALPRRPCWDTPPHPTPQCSTTALKSSTQPSKLSRGCESV